MRFEWRGQTRAAQGVNSTPDVPGHYMRECSFQAFDGSRSVLEDLLVTMADGSPGEAASCCSYTSIVCGPWGLHLETFCFVSGRLLNGLW